MSETSKSHRERDGLQAPQPEVAKWAAEQRSVHCGAGRFKGVRLGESLLAFVNVTPSPLL